MKKLQNYKISVVMPIYNTTEYLEEAIKSVKGQTIGFQNIQLILVINGTDDKAYEICQKHKSNHPDNIECIKLEKNIGVSGARNVGIEYIKGKYVNFMDSDDKWSLDAYELLYLYLEENFEQIDFVSGRIRYFEGRSDWHGLDWKFSKDKEIVDIKSNPEKVQLNVGASLIKSEVLKDFRFDVKVKHAEDAKFLSEIVLNKCKYGLVKAAVFNYRVRKKGNSVLQNVHKSKEWYLDTTKNVYKYLMLLSEKKYDKVISYIQWLIMYELQWRLPIPLYDYLNEEEKTSYVEDIIWLLKHIDDEIILAQRDLWIEYKLFALESKYGSRAYLEVNQSAICINGKKVIEAGKNLYISKVIKEKEIIVEGFIRSYKDLECGKLFLNEEEVKLFCEADEEPLKIFAEPVAIKKKFSHMVSKKELQFMEIVDGKRYSAYPYIFSTADLNMPIEVGDDGTKLFIKI